MAAESTWLHPNDANTPLFILVIFKFLKNIELHFLTFPYLFLLFLFISFIIFLLMLSPLGPLTFGSLYIKHACVIICCVYCFKFTTFLPSFFVQAKLENGMPSEIVSKINLVDLAGR